MDITIEPAQELRLLDAKRNSMQSDLRAAATLVGSALDTAHQLAILTKTMRDEHRMRQVRDIVNVLRSLEKF